MKNTKTVLLSTFMMYSITTFANSYEDLKGEYSLKSEQNSKCSQNLKIEDSKHCSGLKLTTISENGYHHDSSVCDIDATPKIQVQPANPYELGIIGELLGYAGVFQTEIKTSSKYIAENQTLVVAFERQTARFSTKSLTSFKLEEQQLVTQHDSNGYLGQDSINCTYNRK